MPSLSETLADRRKLLLAVTGGVVAVALVAVVLVLVLGGGDGEEAAPVAHPLGLTTPPDTSGVIGVDGQPAPLAQADLDGILVTVEGYLKEATITPLSQKKDGGPTTTAAPGAPTLAGFFTDGTAGRLQGDDRLTLSDEHLPFARGGVSTAKATVALAGIVQDGSAQFVNASIDVVMLVKADPEITVRRSGDLVLRPVDGGWKISGYELVVERAFGDRTTTSEAAFG